MAEPETIINQFPTNIFEYRDYLKTNLVKTQNLQSVLSANVADEIVPTSFSFILYFILGKRMTNSETDTGIFDKNVTPFIKKLQTILSLVDDNKIGPNKDFLYWLLNNINLYSKNYNSLSIKLRSSFVAIILKNIFPLSGFTPNRFTPDQVLEFGLFNLIIQLYINSELIDNYNYSVNNSFISLNALSDIFLEAYEIAKENGWFVAEKDK